MSALFPIHIHEADHQCAALRSLAFKAVIFRSVNITRLAIAKDAGYVFAAVIAHELTGLSTMSAYSIICSQSNVSGLFHRLAVQLLYYTRKLFSMVSKEIVSPQLR
jgi:hypothetical protein